MNTMGINQGTSGNVSIRVPGGFLITPSGVPYETMQPIQVVFIDDEGGYYGEHLPSVPCNLVPTTHLLSVHTTSPPCSTTSVSAMAAFI